MGILRAADAIRRRMDGLLAARGITLPHYNVMRILRGARPAPLSPALIAERTIERIPDLERLLDDLEGRGWAARVASPAGPRAAEWTVTPTALELLAELDGPVAEADRGSVRGLDERDMARLVEILDRIRAQA